MRIVLSEASYAEQAVQSAGQLMAVDKAKLTHAQGQITVGMRLGFVNEHAAGAVHGLYRIVLTVDNGGVHILFIVEPVAGSLPKLAIEDHRGRDLNIAVLLVDLAPVVDKRVFKDHALGQEEREAGAFLGEHEQAKLLAELAVVALFGFLYAGKICVKLVLFHKAGAVNTLEHLAVGIAAPVCAGAGGELYCVALDSAGRIQVRTCAQIGEVALLIEGYDRVLGQVVNKLDLVRLFTLFHEFYCFLARKLESFKLYLFLADLAHLGLDLLEDVGSYGKGSVKVIVKAVFDSRADGQLDLGIKALYRLGEDMACCMAIGVFEFGIFKSVLIFFHDLYSFIKIKTPLTHCVKGVIFFTRSHLDRTHHALNGRGAEAHFLASARERSPTFCPKRLAAGGLSLWADSASSFSVIADCLILSPSLSAVNLQA